MKDDPKYCQKLIATRAEVITCNKCHAFSGIWYKMELNSPIISCVQFLDWHGGNKRCVSRLWWGNVRGRYREVLSWWYSEHATGFGERFVLYLFRGSSCLLCNNRKSSPSLLQPHLNHCHRNFEILFHWNYLPFTEPVMDSNNQKVIILGTGHKVSARVGCSDLGWAMENILVVWMGRQFCLE